MNDDFFHEHWHQIMPKVHATWGQLTKSDLEAVEGDKEQLIGKLRLRYGMIRDQAEMEIDSLVEKIEREETFDDPETTPIDDSESGD